MGVSPQDRTMLICNFCQEDLDQSCQACCHSLSNYVKLFIRHLSPLGHDDIPEVVYGQLFIQGLANALQTRVKTEFKKHL